MTTPAALEYREANHLLMGQAQAEFEAGDLRQASEKGWGAAAQIIKALAESRGRDHYAHYLLIRVVSDLIQETGDDEMLDLFNAAQSLHTNFYENWLTSSIVTSQLVRVGQFVDKLDGFIPY